MALKMPIHMEVASTGFSWRANCESEGGTITGHLSLRGQALNTPFEMPMVWVAHPNEPSTPQLLLPVVDTKDLLVGG
jgi:hypothetical protein